MRMQLPVSVIRALESTGVKVLRFCFRCRFVFQTLYSIILMFEISVHGQKTDAKRVTMEHRRVVLKWNVIMVW
jgi:hypothetical protein